MGRGVGKCAKKKKKLCLFPVMPLAITEQKFISLLSIYVFFPSFFFFISLSSLVLFALLSFFFLFSFFVFLFVSCLLLILRFCVSFSSFVFYLFIFFVHFIYFSGIFFFSFDLLTSVLTCT